MIIKNDPQNPIQTIYRLCAFMRRIYIEDRKRERREEREREGEREREERERER